MLQERYQKYIKILVNNLEIAYMLVFFFFFEKICFRSNNNSLDKNTTPFLFKHTKKKKKL